MKLRLHLQQGEPACLPELESAHTNPWRLAWDTLSTNHPFPLADLLRAVSQAACPPYLSSEQGEEGTQQARAQPNASGASELAEAYPPRGGKSGETCRHHHTACSIAIWSEGETTSTLVLGVRAGSCRTSTIGWDLRLFRRPSADSEAGTRAGALLVGNRGRV